MKRAFVRIFFGFFSVIILFSFSRANENSAASGIISVKLYQNQASVIRSVKISLVKGNNEIIIGGLPKLLYDWSMRGSLPKNFRGKILSLEVEQKALIKKREQLIAKTEEKLESLREKDQVLVDELKNINSQEKFLDAILEFTNQTVSRELATRIPQVQVWDNTLDYVTAKRSSLLKQRRKTEKEREQVGKEIQKWEFELSQIAGFNYFKNYQSLNNAALTRRSAMNVQQYADINDDYARKNEMLARPTEKIDVEKRAIVSIFSETGTEADLTLSYLIPNTFWQMLYDVRASREGKSIDMVVYANIYQKTGENWDDVKLSMSTGSPAHSVTAPELSPWFLDVYMPYSAPGTGSVGGVMPKGKKDIAQVQDRSVDEMMRSEIAPAPVTKIEEKGMFYEAVLPMNHTIPSSEKYQKKYISDFRITDKDNVRFYYQCIPQKERNSFLRVKTINSTALPWLNGEAQIFLENEFLGKVSIPHTSKGGEVDFILGMENRLTARKELVKKYEDTSGLFGGNRRILYKYLITVENHLPETAEVTVYDTIPVSKNEKIKVDLENLSPDFTADEKERKSAGYQNGIRKWKLSIKAGGTAEISYDAEITFDKNSSIRGLH